MAFDAETETVNQTKLLLQRARDIQSKGHVKWETYDPITGGHCMQGSLIKAGMSDPCDVRVAKALGFTSMVQVCAWNNVEARTLPEVLARFDAAIERL